MTQGRTDYNQWVTSYWLSYSINNGYYQTYGENKPIVSAFNLLLKCITMTVNQTALTNRFVASLGSTGYDEKYKILILR